MLLIRAEADIVEGLGALIRLDPGLEPIVRAAGPVPLRLSPPGFAGLSQIIVSQMVSKASAGAIWRRIIQAGPVTPVDYLAHGPEVVAGFGLSRAKAATLEGLARAIMDGELDLDALASLNQEEALYRLRALKGIGAWTAEVYLMFCLGAPDIFPSGDVALRAAVGHALCLNERPAAARVDEIARRWSPRRAVAARLFWAYYATVMRRDALPVD